MAIRATRVSVVTAEVPSPKARLTRISIVYAVRPVTKTGGLMLKGVGS